MLCIGDLHLYVSELPTALRFWGDGLGLTLAEREVTAHSFFARLDFPDGGPSLRLFGPVAPWPPGTRPPYGTHPTVRFDVTTDDFDGVLVRLLESGGRTVDEIEVYNGLRTVTIADPDDNTFELLELV